LGVSSAVQIIAEVGPEAEAFESAKGTSSWVAVCPGSNETAGEAHSTTSPKGNRNMRRLLNQAAQAAVKAEGSIFEITFRKFLSSGMGYKEAIWAIAHRLYRLIWLLLRRRAQYRERGPAVSAKSQRTRAARMIKELRKLGYRVEGGPLPASTVA